MINFVNNILESHNAFYFKNNKGIIFVIEVNSLLS
jgi:hypothetical protein